MLGLTDIDDVILVMNYQSNSGQKVKNLSVTQTVRQRPDQNQTEDSVFRLDTLSQLDGGVGGGSKLVLKLLPG